jgi:hypothetical protein
VGIVRLRRSLRVRCDAEYSILVGLLRAPPVLTCCVWHAMIIMCWPNVPTARWVPNLYANVEMSPSDCAHQKLPMELVAVHVQRRVDLPQARQFLYTIAHALDLR